MDFIADDWQAILQYNKLDSFDALWNLDAEWFEEPNVRRGGWSGVARIELKLPEGKEIGIFLKRQQNHMCKSLWHPIHGTLTIAREFKNIRRFQQINIPALEPVFFGQRRIKGDYRGILLTRELEGFSPMDAEKFRPGKTGALVSIKAHRALFEELAAMLRRLHADNRQHSCLYLKHIFIKPVSKEKFDIRLIDLEKVRWQPFKGRAAFRDLCSLSRHAECWSRTGCMRFFLIYRQEKRLSAASKKLWRAIAAKHAAKAK